MTNATKDNAKLTELTEEGFTKWLASRETKLLISLVPPSDNPDLLQTLLRSAHDAGTALGQGGMALLMIDAMLRGEEKRRGL